MDLAFTTECFIPKSELRNAVGPLIFGFSIQMLLADILRLSL